MPSVGTSDLLESALEAGLEGAGRADEQAILLMKRAPLSVLCEAASAVRSRSKGRTVGYSRKVFIPLTHLCRDYCGYCTFRADPRPGVPPYMLPEEMLAVAEAGRRAG